MKTIAFSQFQATCLSVLERVRKTGEPVIVTRSGEPVAQIQPLPEETQEESRFGCMRGTIEILGDIVEPISADDDWEALR